MTPKNCLVFLLCIVTTYQAIAQNDSSIAIIKRSRDKINSLSAISFRTRLVSRNFLSGDTSKIIIQQNNLYDNNHKIKKVATHSTGSLYDVKDYYQNDTLYSVNLVDSTYSSSYNKNYFISPTTNLAQELSNWGFELWNQNVSKAVCVDTTFEGIDCYKIYIKRKDTNLVASADTSLQRPTLYSYSYRSLYIDKRTLLPIFMKNLSRTTTIKKDSTRSKISFYSTRKFFDYKINNQVDTSVFNFDKSKYTYQNFNYQKALPAGFNAPDLSSLKDLSGNNINMNDLKNKIILIEFKSSFLNAQPNAVKDLNDIYQKYNSKNVAVIDVYYEEKIQDIMKYRRDKHVAFAGYIANKYLINKYHAFTNPEFYLINQSNIIIKSSQAYLYNFKTEYTDAINNFLKY